MEPTTPNVVVVRTCPTCEAASVPGGFLVHRCGCTNTLPLNGRTVHVDDVPPEEHGT